MPFVQTDSYDLRTYECDALGRLRVPALMNLMQESANRNAADYGISITDLAALSLGWMLMRFRLTMHQYPLAGQSIRVVTYPTAVEKYFIYRDFQVRAADDTLLAEAASTWLLFGRAKRGMVPLPDFVRNVAIPPDIAPLPRLSPKPHFATAPLLPDREATVGVGWFSIDANQHVNNVAYIHWLLEALGPDWLANHSLAELDLVYKGETHVGAQLRIQSGGDAGILRHQLSDESGREVVRAQTRWV